MKILKAVIAWYCRRDILIQMVIDFTWGAALGISICRYNRPFESFGEMAMVAVFSGFMIGILARRSVEIDKMIGW